MMWYQGQPINLKLGEELKISPSFRITTIQISNLALKMLKTQQDLLSLLQTCDTTTRHNGLISQSAHAPNDLLCVSSQQAMIGLINHLCQAFNQLSCSESHSHDLPLKEELSRSVQEIPVTALLNRIQVRTDAPAVRANTCLKIRQIA